MKDYVIYLYDDNHELIDSTIIKEKNKSDALRKFKNSNEAKNPEIKHIYIRQWCQCVLIQNNLIR